MARYHVYLCDLDTHILLLICVYAHMCDMQFVAGQRLTFEHHGSSHSDGSGDQIQIVGLTWQVLLPT